LWKIFNFGALRFSGTAEQYASLVFWRDAWFAVWHNIFLFLQPLSWFAEKVGRLELASIPVSILFLPLLPLWSFCFGWISVKLDNWLNHFPVLGKRVF
jgi:hypothetical protein